MYTISLRLFVITNNKKAIKDPEIKGLLTKKAQKPTQREGPTSQRWNNLSIKKDTYCNRLRDNKYI